MTCPVNLLGFACKILFPDQIVFRGFYYDLQITCMIKVGLDGVLAPTLISCSAGLRTHVHCGHADTQFYRGPFNWLAILVGQQNKVLPTLTGLTLSC